MPGLHTRQASTPYPPGFIHGFLTQYQTASTVIGGAGWCRDSTDTVNIVLTGAKIIDITNSDVIQGRSVNLTEGADAWYRILVIAKADGVAPGYLLVDDTEVDTGDFPTDYIYYRQVGWVRNDSGSDFWPFATWDLGSSKWVYLLGDVTTSPEQRVLASGAATAFTDVDCSSAIPPDARQLMYSATASERVRLRPNGNTATNGTVNGGQAGQTTDFGGLIQCDSNQIIEYKGLVAPALTMSVIAYRLSI